MTYTVKNQNIFQLKYYQIRNLLYITFKNLHECFYSFLQFKGMKHTSLQDVSGCHETTDIKMNMYTYFVFKPKIL